jgi:hypothetical protein
LKAKLISYNLLALFDQNTITIHKSHIDLQLMGFVTYLSNIQYPGSISSSIQHYSKQDTPSDL